MHRTFIELVQKSQTERLLRMQGEKCVGWPLTSEVCLQPSLSHGHLFVESVISTDQTCSRLSLHLGMRRSHGVLAKIFKYCSLRFVCIGVSVWYSNRARNFVKSEQALTVPLLVLTLASVQLIFCTYLWILVYSSYHLVTKLNSKGWGLAE